jgi:WD40 repeat protein
MIPPSRITNPFPGLRPFEQTQADLFFGRDEQIEELVDRLRKHRFVAVVGASGSGKSSLVRAGLIPVLERSQEGFMARRWRIAMMRPGRKVMEELADILSKLFKDEQHKVLEALRVSSAGLAKYARQKLEPGESLLLLVDQFEELFRYREQNNEQNQAEDPVAFVKLLLAATGHSEHPLPGLEDVAVYVVITMRSDFLGKCSQFHGLPEVLNESQYLVPRMTRDEQREAIEGPLSMIQGQIDATLVQRLLNEASDNPDQLPVLQHVLMRSWEQSNEPGANGGAICIKDYEDVGTMKGALNRDADRAFAALPDDESKKTARNLFQRLVEPGARDEETRRPTPLSELVAVTACSKAKVEQVIEVFRTRGFLTMSGDDDPIVDIGHESLIRNWKRLSEWVAEESRSVAIYRRLADRAELYRNQQDTLLRGPQLQLALDWRNETEPNEAWARRYYPGFDDAILFLEESRKAREDERARIERKRKQDLDYAHNRARIFAILLVAAALASFVAILFYFDARDSARRAIDANEQSNNTLYRVNISLAHTYAVIGELPRAQRLLDEILNAGLRARRGFEWFYVWRIAHSEHVLPGHSDMVTAVAYSPDGKIIASGSNDRTIKLWDTSSHLSLVTFNGHSGPISALAFSPDGKTLASSSQDSTVKLWDTVLHQEIPTRIGHTGAVQSLAFSPDGKILATGGDDATVKLWDTASRTEIDTFKGHQDSVAQVAFSFDGKILASRTEDSHLKLWDMRSGKELAAFEGDTGVSAIAFSPNGNILATGGDDGGVKLREIPSGNPIGTIHAHTGPASSVVFSPDGETLATGSLDQHIALWNVASRQRIATCKQPSYVVTLSFSPDGKTLASPSDDLLLWDTAWLKGHETLAGPEAGVSAIAFQPPNAALLASGSSEDDYVRLWDMVSPRDVKLLEGHKGSVTSIAFSHDGATIASGSKDATVRLWDTYSRKEGHILSHSSEVLTVAFSVNGTLVSGDAKGKVTLWNTVSGKMELDFEGHTGYVNAVASSPDGKTLATGGSDATIKLWDMKGNTLAILKGHSDSVISLAFSSDGKLASGSIDNTVRLWNVQDVTSPVELRKLEGHSGFVKTVAFSPDNKTLASSSLDQTVRLWDVALGKELLSLKGHTDAVNTIAFSSDGKLLASGSEDKTIKLWRAATDAQVDERRARLQQPLQ